MNSKILVYPLCLWQKSRTISILPTLAPRNHICSEKGRETFKTGWTKQIKAGESNSKPKNFVFWSAAGIKYSLIYYFKCLLHIEICLLFNLTGWCTQQARLLYFVAWRNRWQEWKWYCFISFLNFCRKKLSRK